MSSPLRDLSGNVLGAYHLISLIQSGGMADVYLGERSITGPERQFQHRVAIKVLSQVDDENVRRFGREMEILLTLHQHHPNIVRVLDYATADGGPYGINGRLHYIVMDYLPGGTLADYMVHHSMTVKRFLVVLSQVADALDAAHQAGVIHRDIKPSNILFDRTGNAYLTDFGVAKLAIPNPDTRDQTAGQILGTVAYMAPETFDSTAVLTPKADIYSLGVVTYLILGGQLPFDGNQPTPALIKAIYLDAPPLLSDVNPHFSPRVAAVVQKAIARDPQTRYATSGEFVRALRDSFESTAALSPIAAPPELERMALGSPETLGGTRAKRWRWSLLLAGCLLLVALVIGGVLAWQTNLFEGHDRDEVASVGRVESVTATATPATTVAATATATAAATATQRYRNGGRDCDPCGDCHCNGGRDCDYGGDSDSDRAGDRYRCGDCDGDRRGDCDGSRASYADHDDPDSSAYGQFHAEAHDGGGRVCGREHNGPDHEWRIRGLL